MGSIMSQSDQYKKIQFAVRLGDQN
uniref:Uncharacterized protein n=1 Tax=Arundo donax TaxID=35708 RepID=A0A0A9GRE5_ARUDO